MNNGTQSLSTLISELLFEMPFQKEWEFLLRSEHLSEKDKRKALQRNDFKIITGLSNTHMSIANSDIVLARGGYNILSELLALNKPAVLIEENSNPEIESNLSLAKEYKNLKISIKREAINTLQDLMNLIKNEKNSQKDNFSGLSCNGAPQILLKIADDFGFN